MKTSFGFIAVLTLAALSAFAQDPKPYQISTIFRRGQHPNTSAYVALNNKFTTLAGKHANIVEIYGGLYQNHRLLIGLEAAALTNEMVVPYPYWTADLPDARYYYGQFGVMTEYIFGSGRAVHMGVQMLGGYGFTLMYSDATTTFEDYWNDAPEYDDDQNWFPLIEPGVRLEVNVFRWLRISPGISYRISFGGEGRGMSDKEVRGASFNTTLKIGRF